MGTRMVSSAESPVHDRYKQLVVDAQETGTVFLNRWHKPGFRVLATPRSEAHEQNPEQVALGTLDGILRLYFEGDLDAAFAFGGQVAGRIDEVRPVARDRPRDDRRVPRRRSRALTQRRDASAASRRVRPHGHDVGIDPRQPGPPARGPAHPAREAQYFDDLTPHGTRARRVRALDDGARAHHRHRHERGRRRCPAWSRSTRSDTLELARVQGFVMLPPVFSRPAARRRRRALRRRHRRGGGRRDHGAGGRRGRDGRSSTTTRSRPSSIPKPALADGRRCAVPRARLERVLRAHGDGCHRRSRRARGRRRGGVGALREPAPRRRPDGGQRHHRRAGRRRRAHGHGPDAGAVRRARPARRGRSASSPSTCACWRPRSAAASAPRPARTAST